MSSAQTWLHYIILQYIYIYIYVIPFKTHYLQGSMIHVTTICKMHQNDYTHYSSLEVDRNWRHWEILPPILRRWVAASHLPATFSAGDAAASTGLWTAVSWAKGHFLSWNLAKPRAARAPFWLGSITPCLPSWTLVKGPVEPWDGSGCILICIYNII